MSGTEYETALKDYNQLTAATAIAIDAERSKWNNLMKLKDKNWETTYAATQKDNYINEQIDTHRNAFDELNNEYNRMTEYQSAAQRMKHTADYISNMQNVILDSNKRKLGDVNVDMMTARRVAAINTENVVRLENISAYFRTCIITLCVAILIMAVCVSGYISLPLANILLVVVATGLVIALIYRAYDNSNRIKMLFPEREWPLMQMASDKDDECGCPAKPPPS